MDVIKCHPLEIFEEIFRYLSVKDLVSCSEVSQDWRKVANSNALWRPICEKLSWKDPLALVDVISNFSKEEDQFSLPQLSDRLLPMSDWKLNYCQQQFVSYNWHKGQCATHILSESVTLPRVLSFAPIESGRPSLQFLPVVEEVDDRYEFNIVRIDGKPRKVWQLEEDMADEIYVVCVAGNTIAYVIDNRLKIVIYQNEKFNLIRDFVLDPTGDELRSMSKLMMSNQYFISYFHYFMYMNFDYLVAGHNELYFYVWDCKTWDKLDFVLCPIPQSRMFEFCLYDKYIYFVINRETCHDMSFIYEVYEYNIEEKSLKLFVAVYFRIVKIFCNKRYLINVLRVDSPRYDILIYDRATQEKVNHIRLHNNFKIGELKVLLENDLLFCLDSGWLKVISVPGGELKTKVKVEGMIVSMYNVRQNLIILIKNEGVQVLDWEKGVSLYTLSLDFLNTHLYQDNIRLILTHVFAGRTQVLGFW